MRRVSEGSMRDITDESEAYFLLGISKGIFVRVHIFQIFFNLSICAKIRVL